MAKLDRPNTFVGPPKLDTGRTFTGFLTVTTPAFVVNAGLSSWSGYADHLLEVPLPTTTRRTSAVGRDDVSLKHFLGVHCRPPTELCKDSLAEPSMRSFRRLSQNTSLNRARRPPTTPNRPRRRRGH